MEALSMAQFTGWLNAYGAAWEAGDADAAVALFTADAAYYETPFDDPMVGTEAIHRYWTGGAGESQKEVEFSHEALAVVGNVGLARWHASFVRIRTEKHVELDGFLMAEFAGAGKCAVFREWWHRREANHNT
jgi:ketosteroid isomerase-like protein